MAKAKRTNGEGGDDKRAELKRRLKDSQDSAWKKQAGGIFLVVFMCGAGLFQFMSTVFSFLQGSGITHLEYTDTAVLKKALFSGEPWLVYCVNNETMTQRLPQVLESGAANSLRSSLGLNTATLNCWDKTESGRSVAERFKLNLKPPLSFVVANGNQPRQLNFAGITEYDQLEKRISPALRLSINKIDTLKKWGSMCSGRKSCIVIGYKNIAQRDAAVAVFKPLHEQNRALKIVTLDTAFWQLKLNEAVLETRSTQKRGKAAEVLCLSRMEEPGKNSSYHGVFLKDIDNAQSFVQECTGQQNLVKLDSSPKINARPSKPKKVKAPPIPSTPPPRKEQPKKKGSVDHVGSREGIETEEDPLFEAVDEEEDGYDEGGERQDEEDEDEDDADEVEL